jgi:FkbM family methyltransferase
MNLQEFDLGPVKEALRLTGRAPARHALVVRAIRRVLWPFIRPYHFVSLEWTRDRLVETYRRIDAIPEPLTIAEVLEALPPLPPPIDHRRELEAITDSIDALEHRLHERIERRIDDRINSGVVSASFAQAAVRAEVIAVSRTLEQWRGRVEDAESGQTEVKAQLSELGGRTKELAERLGGFGEALRVAQDRMNETIQGHHTSMALRFRQIEQRLSGPNGGRSDAAETPFTGLGAGSFTLGNAVFFESDFGPMIMRPVDMVTRHFVQSGTWDEHVLKAMRNVADRAGARGADRAGARGADRAGSNGAGAAGRVAVDAGAHYGVISCMMATLFETVHAFEANRETYLFLCANAALRPPGRIRPHNLALWSSATTVSLARPEEQEIRIRDDLPLEAAFRAVENPGSLCFAPEGSGVNTIDARALDDFALQDVGFIKIDCQGADGHVIMGALDTIRRCRPVVVFEWENLLAADRGISLDQVIGVLAAIGYQVTPLYVHNEKQIDYIAMPPDGRAAD